MEKLRAMAEEGYPSNEIRRMVQDAISSGIGLDKCDLKDGNSLLHQCILQTDLQDCVIKLLSAGANSNVTNSKGETPYDIALDNGNQIVMHLLDRRREYKRQVFSDSDVSLPWQNFSLDGTSTVFLQVIFEDYIDWSDSTRINQLNNLIDQAKNDEGKYQQKLQDLLARKSKSGQNLQKLQELLKKKEIKQRVKWWEIQDLIKLNLRAVDIISEDLEKIKKILEKAETKIYWRGFVEIRRYKGLIFQKWREASLVVSGSELVIDYSRDHEDRMSPEDEPLNTYQSSSTSSTVSPLTAMQNAWSLSHRTTSVSHSQVSWKDGPLRRQLRMMSSSSSNSTGNSHNSTSSTTNQRRIIHIPIHLIRTLHINKLIGDNGLEHEITISYFDEQNHSKNSTPITSTSACSFSSSTASSLLASTTSQHAHVRSQSIISSSYSMNWQTTSSTANTPIVGVDDAAEDRDSFCQADLLPGGKLRTVHLRQMNANSHIHDTANSKNRNKKTSNKSMSTSSVDALPYVVKSLFADVNVICTLNGSPTHFLDPTVDEVDLDELFSIEDTETVNTIEHRRHQHTGNSIDRDAQDDDEEQDNNSDRRMFQSSQYPTRRARRATIDAISVSPVSSTSFLTSHAQQFLDMDDIGSTTNSSLTSHSQSSNLSQVLMRAAQSNRSSLSGSSLSSHSHYHSSGSSSGATSVESVSTLTSAMQQYSRRNASLLASQLMGIEEEEDLNNNSFNVAGSRTRRSSASSVCSNGNNNATITSRTRNNSVIVYDTIANPNSNLSITNGHNNNNATVRNSAGNGTEDAELWRISDNASKSQREASITFSMDGDNQTCNKNMSAAIPIVNNNQNHLQSTTNTGAMSLDSHLAIAVSNTQKSRNNAHERTTQSIFLSSQMWRTATTVSDASTATTVTTTVSTTVAKTPLWQPPSLLSPVDLSSTPGDSLLPQCRPSCPQRSMSLAQSSPTRSNSLHFTGRNNNHNNVVPPTQNCHSFLLHNRRAPSFQLSNHSLSSLPSPYRLRGRTVKLKEIKERAFAIDVRGGVFYRSPYLHEQMAAQIDFIPVLRWLQEHTKYLRDEMKEQLHMSIMHREELKQEYEYLFSLRTLAGNPPQAPTSVFNMSSMFASPTSNIQSYSSQEFLTLHSNQSNSNNNTNIERAASLLNLYTNHVDAVTLRLRDDTDNVIASTRPSFNDTHPSRSSYSMHNTNNYLDNNTLSTSLSHSMSYSNTNPNSHSHCNSNVVEARELLHWLTQFEHGLNEVMHALYHPSQRTFSSSSSSTSTPNTQIHKFPSVPSERIHSNVAAASVTTANVARLSPWRDSLHKLMTSPEDLQSMRVRLQFDDEVEGDAHGIKKPTNEEKKKEEEWTQRHLLQSTSEKVSLMEKECASIDHLGNKDLENTNGNRHNSQNHMQGMQSWRNRLGPPPPAYRRYFEKLLSNVEQIWNCELESYETFKKLAASILLREQTLRRIASLRSKQRELVTATHRNTVVPPPKEELYDVEF